MPMSTAQMLLSLSSLAQVVMALGQSRCAHTHGGVREEPEPDSDGYVPSEYNVNSDDEPPEEGPGDLIDVSSDKLVQKTLVQPGHGFIRPRSL